MWRVGRVNDLEALQWGNRRQARIRSHKNQFIRQSTCRGDGTGELNGIEATQWEWLHLPILGAEGSRHRRDGRRDGDEEVDRKCAARVAQGKVALEGVLHGVDKGGMQRSIAPQSPERSHDLNFGKLREIDWRVGTWLAQLLHPRRPWLPMVAFDDGAAIEEVTWQTYSPRSSSTASAAVYDWVFPACWRCWSISSHTVASRCASSTSSAYSSSG